MDSIPVDGDFFKSFWINIVPLKVVSLAWRMMQNGIPSRVNLRRRGIIHEEGDIKCVLFNNMDESTTHLFFSSRISYEIWTRCYAWLGVQTALPEDGTAHFLQHSGYHLCKKSREVWFLIWFTIVWSIWLHRNGILFRGEELDLENLVDSIKMKAWHWIRANVDGAYFSFMEWHVNPLECIKQCKRS